MSEISSVTIEEISLFATNEETQEIDFELSDGPTFETLAKFSEKGKKYTFSYKKNNPSSSKINYDVKFSKTSTIEHIAKNNLAPLFTGVKSESRPPFFSLSSHTQQPRKEFSKTSTRPPKKENHVSSVHTDKVRSEEKSHKRQESKNRLTLQNYRWSKEETHAWWENRYEQQKEERQEEGSKRSPPSQKESQPTNKPFLERPKTGIFALYYILTKIGIASDATSHFSYKKEIEGVDEQTTEAHKKRLEEVKKAIEKEHSSAQWGVAKKVFSWIGSLTGIVTGALLIASGVGAVAGAIIIAGGVLQITNQILELTGGWKKIAELLPGNDPDMKRAVITWMQIGIAVLSLILAGVGVIWGGFGHVSQISSIGGNFFICFVMMGGGITAIGEGVQLFMFNDKMSEVRRYDKVLAELKHKREDLMEKIDWGRDRLYQLFEDLLRYLEFEETLFKADQMIYQ